MSIDTLYVQTQGSYGREALIFLHAFPLSSDMWGEQMEIFSKTHYTLAPDLPGFGKGELPHYAITFEYYVDSVLYFLKEAGIKKSIWCGNSLGGYLALRLYQKAPELCSGLILVDTKATADNDLDKLRRWSQIKKLHSNKEEFLEKQWQSLVGKSTRNNFLLKRKFYEMASRNSEEGLSASLVSIATRIDCSEMLSEIDVPTLILVGEEDKVTPFSDAQHMHKKISGSKIEIIKKAGHLSSLENPTHFNRVISDFLTSLYTTKFQDCYLIN